MLDRNNYSIERNPATGKIKTINGKPVSEATVQELRDLVRLDMVQPYELDDAVGANHRIFIIAALRGANEAHVEMLKRYKAELEEEGAIVHLPHEDTKQDQSGIQICRDNMSEIRKADQVHIFYDEGSEGTLFDMGMAFAMGKPIVVVRNAPYGEGKSFPRMLDEWAVAGERVL